MERRTIAKVSARLSTLIVCYFVAYLIESTSFAALTMNKESVRLAFGFGPASSPRHAEVPSNLFLERRGARIARIMFTWGLLGGMAFIGGE